MDAHFTKEIDPKQPLLLQLFKMQWGLDEWRLVQKYSRMNVKRLKLGTDDAVSMKPNMHCRHSSGDEPMMPKGQTRPAPSYSLPFLIRLHVIIQAMEIVRLPGRRYYWMTTMPFVGVKDIKDLMSQKEFDQGMRGLCTCDQ